ncbi:hypothetical protein ZWY2020_032668 [Hordeum vulgare]|nr:hypothetical protein ZWY2020_032668 [Hordeum vulgare]
MGRNSETSVAGEGSGSDDLRRRRGGQDGAGASSSSSFTGGTREFVLSSMDERFSGSVDPDGFPSSRCEGFGHSKSTTATSGHFRGQDHAFLGYVVYRRVLRYYSGKKMALMLTRSPSYHSSLKPDLGLGAELPTAALRRLYDTSNYGMLQLNNSLALVPQMG